MALVVPGMRCGICGEELLPAEEGELIGFSGSIAEPDDPLSFFNDAAFHRKCFQAHPLAAQAVERDREHRERHPIFLGPGEGESIPGEHRDFVVKAERDELEVIEFACDPEFGPVPPHVHPDKVDSFFILEGELEFTIGEETVRAGPGSYVAAPPGVRHGFRNPGPGRARFLNVHAPSDGFIERVRREANPEPED